VGLIFFVVIRRNQCIFDKTPGAISPYSNFNLRKINNLIDFGYNNGCLLNFGDYVEADTLDPTTNGMESRTEGCIALYPTGNSNGSWRFLNLGTNQYVTRYKWKKLPTPPAVIERINRLAANERTPIPVDPVWQYRDREVNYVELIEHTLDPLMMPQVRDPGIVGEAVRDAAAAHARDMEDADVEVPDQDRRTRSITHPLIDVP
jgi:hypothetical protein